MPPLASAGVYLVDRAIEKGYIAPPDQFLPAAAGGWATLAQVRPLEAQVALERGQGPLAPHRDALPGGATNPLGLGALATACGAAAGAFRLPRFPDG